jgi:hypothetical protein
LDRSEAAPSSAASDKRRKGEALGALPTQPAQANHANLNPCSAFTRIRAWKAGLVEGLCLDGYEAAAVPAAWGCHRAVFPMSLARRALALTLALVLLGLAALEAGFWIRVETRHGPFSGEGGNPALYVPIERSPVQCCLAARPDTNEAPQQSRMRVWVGDAEYITAHADHERIRRGDPGVFSHWAQGAYLALPADQPNDARAVVRLSYPLQIRSRTISLGLIALVGIALAAVLGTALHPTRVLAGVLRRRRLVSALLAAALAGALALELGLWQRTEIVAGPFAVEAGSKMVRAPVSRDSGLVGLLGAREDSNAAPQRSGLRLYLGDRAYTLPHTYHDRIRTGEVGPYSHWAKGVYFALPEGVANGPGTHVRLVYPVQIASPWTSAVLIAVLALLCVVVAKPWLTRERLAPLLRLPALGTLGLAWAAAALTCLYAAVTFGAWLNGWGLPSTAVIVETSLGRWLAAAEPHFSEIVLGIATLGAVAGWIAAWRGFDQAQDEARILRLLGRVGIPILFGALVFSASAQWSGLWRPGDFSGAAIAGLVPYSDASAYYADSNDVVKDAVFGPLGSRRPLAQAFRSTLMALGGYHYATMIVVQSLIIALAAFAAGVAVARWRGLWAALAFVAIIYTIARQFHATALTESLGLFWGLAAIPFLVEALRRRSVIDAVMAAALLAVALLTRMGSMFTVPALLLWLVWSFGTTVLSKARIAAAAVAVLLGIVALNSVVTRIYVRDTWMVGSNFSYAVCGLTIGGVWSDCVERYQNELPPSERFDEKALVDLMYQKAYENFTARPSVFAGRVADGAAEFTITLPSILTRGHQPVPPLFDHGLLLFCLVAAVGLLRLVPRMPRHEISFWLLFWASAVASAGFVYFDDGRRVMIAIYPIAALFLTSGLRTGEALTSRANHSLVIGARTGAAAAAAILLVILVTPWLVHTAFRPSEYITRKSAGSGEQFVFGGRRITGVLVVADGEPLRTDVPTVHLSDFASIVRRSGIETYQGLVTPKPPPLPFGFILSPQLVIGEPTAHQFIVPPEVMTRKEVRAWRFETADFQPKPGFGPYWLLVTKADPLPPAPQHVAAEE